MGGPSEMKKAFRSEIGRLSLVAGVVLLGYRLASAILGVLYYKKPILVSLACSIYSPSLTKASF